MGVYLLWEQMDYGEPSFDEMQAMYGLQEVVGQKGYYYLTRYTKGVEPVVTGLKDSFGNWKGRFVFVPAEMGEEVVDITYFRLASRSLSLAHWLPLMCF